jgi:hypothetical protein
MKHCDYYGCNKPLAPDQPRTGMKFCAEHDAEFAIIARQEPFSPTALLKFWIEAQGGAKQAAKRVG